MSYGCGTIPPNSSKIRPCFENIIFNNVTLMERIITFLAFPALLPFVIAYKMGKSHELCRQDLIATLHHRSNPFRKELFQLLYFILWLPEYRSVFYRRNKKFGLIFRILLHPQKCLYIRTSSSRMGGVLLYNMGIRQKSMLYI